MSLRLSRISKKYRMGDSVVHALRDVSLEIESGDYVAIMGPSGSGKSTLMHVLGLLDMPESGRYEIDGTDISTLSDAALAELRRERIGFIFQQFNLLPRLTAAENVALPLIYSRSHLDVAAAQPLLAQVGLERRGGHRPNELSGGQQQRVAIARSLVNQPAMILADEPTGNLDSKSEEEILGILQRLNDSGITVVVVTHEPEVGNRAKRLIRMRDGVVQSDERLRPLKVTKSAVPEGSRAAASGRARWQEFVEYSRQGAKTLLANKVRTALSILGILIGVASVVAMLAIGSGAQKDIEERLASMGTNLLVLRAGAARVGGVRQEAGGTARITDEDVRSLAKDLPLIRALSPSVTGRAQTSFGNRNWNTQLQGSGPDYESVKSATPSRGRFFDHDDVRKRARVAVIGLTVYKELFGDRDPLGETIRINKISFQVIGILPEKGSSGWRDEDDVIVMPYTTAMYRVLGKKYIDSVDIEVRDPERMSEAEDQIRAKMAERHHVRGESEDGAFDVRNMAEIRSALSASSRTMSLLLASIAAISLLVGGIGIMNIMLVSVTERTREIGLRKAIGARSADILIQFLAESVVVTTAGGTIGIILGWLISWSVSLLAGWATSVSVSSVVLAFGFSCATGLIFGIYPARQASRLNPIEALRHD